MPDVSARPLWTAAEVAAATGGALHGEDRPITGLTYNSREIVAGPSPTTGSGSMRACATAGPGHRSAWLLTLLGVGEGGFRRPS